MPKRPLSTICWNGRGQDTYHRLIALFDNIALDNERRRRLFNLRHGNLSLLIAFINPIAIALRKARGWILSGRLINLIHRLRCIAATN
jgi:hypothetical protein